ncbi:MAG TPA: lipoprotein insertase outer membrane protein LolB [Arenimonas sp.]|uniref:lipoprotein insertase outer membrane protein LolB n=1 Tax=Arenimonas sp. TaxID=1872635 RepID=UPI002D7F2C9C|nr:lipoprotein insertase outer membrane protein LolB [Arenimonas sp.]HEU0152854.1 lipoprotein insertase outer membrane protein LolB [Arenimonas sp.]
MKPWLPLLCLAALLSACTPAPLRRSGDAALLSAQAAREAALAETPDWSLSGRLSVSAGGDGGSGRLDWRQQGGDFEIRLAAPVTGKSWRLRQQGDVATLEGLEGGPRTAANAETLLFEATGWRLPVQALAAWARGARAGAGADIEFGPDGLPALISEQGWQVEYREWDAAEPARPRRVFARQGDQASVRLVVEAWDAP